MVGSSQHNFNTFEPTFESSPAHLDPLRQVSGRLAHLCGMTSDHDGTRVEAGYVLVRLHGPTRSLLTGERAALNFLQRMSGIATLTRVFVDAVGGLPVRVLDTRKTAPGLRGLDKYAVTAGGGQNHRPDLGAMVLLKENHIAAAGGVTAAIDAVRAGMAREGKQVAVDVEVQHVHQAEEAMRAGASGSCWTTSRWRVSRKWYGCGRGSRTSRSSSRPRATSRLTTSERSRRPVSTWSRWAH